MQKNDSGERAIARGFDKLSFEHQWFSVERRFRTPECDGFGPSTRTDREKGDKKQETRINV
jgi:hypothetical protein